MLPRQPIKLSNLDKSLMKYGKLFNKHFCKKKSIIRNESAEIVNFHFLNYKSMGTLSCHSNESSWTLKIQKKNITFVNGNVISNYAKFQLHPPYVFEKKTFEYVFENLPYITNQIKRFGQKSYDMETT